MGGSIRTEPAGELCEADAVLPVFGQQVEGPLGHRVRVRSAGPWRQQQVQALKLGTADVAAFDVSAAHCPRLSGGRVCPVPPVQADEVLSLEHRNTVKSFVKKHLPTVFCC